MTALIGTCVIVDALQNREPFAQNAQNIFLYAANKRFDGFITAKAVTDIYYLTHKYTHSDKEPPNILSKLFVIFDLLHTKTDCIVTRNIKDYKNAPVSIYSPADFLKLINSTEENT